MAFRSARRRFSGRRRFGGRGVARKEPIWISTAYFVDQIPSVIQQQLFQLVGPEDYTPDYLTEPQRLEKCTLVRTVGSFNLQPTFSTPEVTQTVFTAGKAALFIAGDKHIEDSFANDPAQFNITNPLVFPPFCRDFAPMHIFWSWAFGDERRLTGGTGGATAKTRVPPHPGEFPWDVTVKRKLHGDDALWLLINLVFAQSPADEIGGQIDVESRNLIMDQ